MITMTVGEIIRGPGRAATTCPLRLSNNGLPKAPLHSNRKLLPTVVSARTAHFASRSAAWERTSRTSARRRQLRARKQYRAQELRARQVQGTQAPYQLRIRQATMTSGAAVTTLSERSCPECRPILRTDGCFGWNLRVQARYGRRSA